MIPCNTRADKPVKVENETESAWEIPLPDTVVLTNVINDQRTQSNLERLLVEVGYIRKLLKNDERNFSCI